MNSWFECKIKYEKTLDDGVQKVVTESYLVDAFSFTDAEATINKEMQPFLSDMFSVSNIKRVKYADCFFNETGDRYYKARLYFISLDEKNGTEKKTAHNILVQASELKEAVEIVEAEMKKTMIDYSLTAVTELPLMDVYMHTAEVKTEPQHEHSHTA